MDELERRVSTLLLAREGRAPEPRAGLTADVLAAARHRALVQRATRVAIAAGLVAVVAVAVPFLRLGGTSSSAPPAGQGGTKHATTQDARPTPSATLQCYSYQRETGFLRPVDYLGSPVGQDGPRSAIEAWWASSDEIPFEWNTDVVVERDATTATEVILRTDETVAAVVELAETGGGWRITGVNACD